MSVDTLQNICIVLLGIAIVITHIVIWRMKDW